jgi:hypothetical protein
VGVDGHLPRRGAAAEVGVEPRRRGLARLFASNEHAGYSEPREALVFAGRRRRQVLRFRTPRHFDRVHRPHSRGPPTAVEEISLDQDDKGLLITGRVAL